ncbi:MAG TPA: 3'-5' exonuclease [Gammaproteobacteria bacterium]|nr:3'-5' exonuclease [Gammaproteobacteria bacterium]
MPMINNWIVNKNVIVLILCQFVKEFAIIHDIIPALAIIGCAVSNVFVFDIETIPDTKTGRRLHGIEGSEAEVAQAMFAKVRGETQREFLPLHLQKIIAISVVLASDSRIKVWSLGDEQADEADLITRFYKGIEHYIPTLVSWNGSGFDLPVLHYRALLHGISAPAYWETGERETRFRWNNYLSRYHYRHLDLMDVLAAYQPRACAPLTEVAVMLGFPGKMGMSGDAVFPAYLAGDLKGIRNYCETDVINTYLIYLQFELMRGNLSLHDKDQKQQQLKESLLAENKPHLTEFVTLWGR